MAVKRVMGVDSAWFLLIGGFSTSSANIFGTHLRTAAPVLHYGDGEQAGHYIAIAKQTADADCRRRLHIPGSIRVQLGQRLLHPAQQVRRLTTLPFASNGGPYSSTNRVGPRRVGGSAKLIRLRVAHSGNGCQWSRCRN